MEGTSDTWKVPQIHGMYLRYMEGTSDTWNVPQIHGRYLRYMECTSDTWKVPQIHLLCLKSVNTVIRPRLHFAGRILIHNQIDSDRYYFSKGLMIMCFQC